MRITLPIPSAKLSPNSRAHWAVRSKLTKRHRQVAEFGVGAQIKQNPPRWKRAKIQYHFFWPDKRRRDDDNAIGRCKAYRDGLADAGVVADDVAFVTMPPIMDVDRNNPRLEIEIEP